jgi:hypothetical protein
MKIIKSAGYLNGLRAHMCMAQNGYMLQSRILILLSRFDFMVSTLDIRMELPIGKGILRSLEPRMLSSLELMEDVRSLTGRMFNERLYGLVLSLWEKQDYVRMIPEVQEYDLWDPPAEFGVRPRLPRDGRPRKYDVEYEMMMGVDTGDKMASRGPKGLRRHKRNLPSLEESVKEILRWSPATRSDLSYLSREMTGKTYNEAAFNWYLNDSILKGRISYNPASRVCSLPR